MERPRHSEEEVKRALAGMIETIFRACVMAGWRDYNDDSLYAPKARLVHCKRTRACIVYNHVRARLIEALEGLPRAKALVSRGLTVVLLDDLFLIKVPKRLSRKRISRTYPTNQTLAFLTQGRQYQDSFPYLSQRTTLIVGYVLDDLELEVESVYVTCPKSPRRNFFSFELAKPAAAMPDDVMKPGPGLPDSALPPADADEKKEEEG